MFLFSVIVVAVVVWLLLLAHRKGVPSEPPTMDVQNHEGDDD